MANKTTEIHLMHDGVCFAVYRKMQGSWKHTYFSYYAIADSFDNASTIQDMFTFPFNSIKELEKLALFYGFKVRKMKTAVIFKRSSKDRAKVYAEKRKNQNDKKLAVWLTPGDFGKLHELKQSLYELKIITRPSLEETVRHMIHVHPKTPF